MEILALLLLGLIAMLAIVPPIIRGRIEESPLATTQSFQRSMEEIAHSIESGSRRSAREYRNEAAGGYRGYPASAAHPRSMSPITSHRRRASAAARRNRVIAMLTFLAFTWGVVTLFSGKTWCLALFASFSVLLIVFWLLTILVPYMTSPARPARRESAAVRHPSRHQDREAV